jgi:hypothetical protein
VARVGILTFSDGRHFVHEGAGVGTFAQDVENDIVGALEIVRARKVVWTPRASVEELGVVCKLLDVDYDGFGGT